MVLKQYFALREKCLNTEVFPNTGKYGPEKPPYLDTFRAVLSIFPYCTYPMTTPEKN